MYLSAQIDVWKYGWQCATREGGQYLSALRVPMAAVVALVDDERSGSTTKKVSMHTGGHAACDPWRT